MRKISLLILSLFFILYFDAISQPTNVSKSGVFYPEVERRSVIIGKIVNLDKFPDAPKTIELHIDDITIDHQHAFITSLSDDGTFVFDVPLYHSINTYLNYGELRTTPYLFPNDTLYINGTIGYEGFRFGLLNAMFDKEHNKFETQFLNSYDWLFYDKISAFFDTLDIIAPPEINKIQCMNFEIQLLDEIELKVKNDSLNQILSDYLKFSAKYYILSRIINYGKKIKDKETRKQYYSFLSDTLVFNNDALLTSSYASFLNAYHYVDEWNKFRTVSDSDKLTDYNSEEQKQQVQLTKEVTKSIEIRKGIWGEYLAAKQIYFLFSSEKEITKPSIEHYRNMINNTFTDTYIKQLLVSKSKESRIFTKEIIDQSLPKDAVLLKDFSLSGEKIFNNILAKNKGKVIYIDFWATWCSPCKAEIPHSMRLYDKYRDKNVSFVFVCSLSDEEAWENQIKKYQIKGENILLNNKQNDYFKNKFSLVSIPRYILVNSSGVIVNSDAARPSTEEIITVIDNMLKEK